MVVNEQHTRAARDTQQRANTQQLFFDKKRLLNQVLT